MGDILRVEGGGDCGEGSCEEGFDGDANSGTSLVDVSMFLCS